MRKIAVIFGTRPEAIKLCPVVLKLKDTPAFDCRVCVTGQHREMLQQVLDVFHVVPDVNLNLMRPNQTLAGLTARAVDSVNDYLSAEKPDAVIVQGDTTTVLAGALAAFYQHIPVAHVEAGLRTGNFDSPCPEEMNRVLTTRLAKWHFAPTELNRENLLADGVPDSSIHVVGNTVIDALLQAREMIRRDPPEIKGLPEEAVSGDRTVVLVTGHRRENFGRGFEDICTAIQKLAAKFPEVSFVYPVHLNPNVRAPVEKLLGDHILGNVFLIPPQDYLPFVSLMSRAKIILTDSGGVQEEAPGLGKPVLVMRDTTERPEAVAAGTVKVIGTSPASIVSSVETLLTSKVAYAKMAAAVNPYGDGQAVPRIVSILEKALS